MSLSDKEFGKKITSSTSRLLEKIVEDLLNKNNIEEVGKIILDNLRNLQIELDQFYNIIYELYKEGSSLCECHLEIEHFKENLEHCLRIIKKIVTNIT